jgi:hypothetical protein
MYIYILSFSLSFSFPFSLTHTYTARPPCLWLKSIDSTNCGPKIFRKIASVMERCRLFFLVIIPGIRSNIEMKSIGYMKDQRILYLQGLGPGTNCPGKPEMTVYTSVFDSPYFGDLLKDNSCL